MKALSIAVALPIALTLGTGIALAQSAPHLVDGKNTTTPHPQYKVGSSSAHIGQSWKPAPYSYDIGGGSAKVGDGSDPNYLKNQQHLRDAGGYSIGSGSARKSGGNN